MNCSYFLWIFWCCLWGIIFEGSKFQFRKIVLGPRVSVRAYIKKINIACPTDKGNAGRLTIIANKCSIVWMSLVGIHPGDSGTLTIIANKCSIIRNVPCRMNMHPPQCPDPCPLHLPQSELHHHRPPILPRCRAHVALRWFVWRCMCEEQGSRLPEQPQSLHQLGSSRWAKWLSTSPLLVLWYGSSGGGPDAEGRWKPQSSLFQVCKELSE
jgi:hypothetical protein